MRFGDCDLDAGRRVLVRRGKEIPLAPKAFELLELLVSRRPEVVTKEQILERLWPRTYVADGSVHNLVQRLRATLGDDPKEPRLIRTVPRIGYAFEGDVDLVPPSDEAPPDLLGPTETPSAAALPLTQGAHQRRLRLAVGVLLLASLALASGVWWRRHREATPLPGILKDAVPIAVLPFQNFGGRVEDEWFADGMTDSLITDLTRLRGLLVIARTSVFAYKGKAIDVKVVGRELGVRYVLEGSVQRESDRMRLNVQLIDCSSGYHLWAERYDRPHRDLLPVEDEISQRVFSALQVKVAETAEQRQPTRSPAAYEAYLRGRFHRYKPDPSDPEAISFFEKAIALDPEFALAHVGLAAAYTDRFFTLEARKEWEEKAYVEIEKALGLDAGLAEAYSARADLTWTPDHSYPHERAIRDYRRAIELNPSFGEAHGHLGNLYLHLGLLEAAAEESAACMRLDPIDHQALSNLARVWLFRGEYRRVLDEAERQPEIKKHFVYAEALGYLGREREALAAVDDMPRFTPPMDRWASAYRAVLLARLGDAAGSRQEIKFALGADASLAEYHHVAYWVGSALAVLGDKQPALLWLRRAAENGMPSYPLFKSDPNLAPVSGAPAFQALLANLKKQWEYFQRL